MAVIKRQGKARFHVLYQTCALFALLHLSGCKLYQAHQKSEARSLAEVCDVEKRRELPRISWSFFFPVAEQMLKIWNDLLKNVIVASLGLLLPRLRPRQGCKALDTGCRSKCASYCASQPFSLYFRTKHLLRKMGCHTVGSRADEKWPTPLRREITPYHIFSSLFISSVGLNAE